jgi:hypothetical protein
MRPGSARNALQAVQQVDVVADAVDRQARMMSSAGLQL